MNIFMEADLMIEECPVELGALPGAQSCHGVRVRHRARIVGRRRRCHAELLGEGAPLLSNHPVVMDEHRTRSRGRADGPLDGVHDLPNAAQVRPSLGVMGTRTKLASRKVPFSC
jgi:hypothetical protein